MSSYTAVIEFIEDPHVVQCECDQCDWAGTADQLRQIGLAILTPGHQSPAGRCPECDALAYVKK